MTWTKTWKVKEFTTRNSLLFDLSENKHIRTTYNLFLVIFVGFVVNSMVHSFVEHNEVSFGLKYVKLGFAGFHIVVLTWLLYLLVSCVAFRVFIFWATNREFCFLTTWWDRGYLILAAVFYVSFSMMAAFIVSHFKLPIGSAAVVLIEQTKFLVKFHSFARNNIAKVLSKDSRPLPKFSHYFYFLFAPTLLYQDSYPRRDKIDWNFAFYRLVECVAIVFFLSFVGEKLLLPPLRDFGLRKYTVTELLVIFFENTVTGIFVLVASFFVILHSCYNFFAEITRFGDRMFYSDWWTCTNYGCYFRKWNIVVQEWLFIYVYKECTENFGLNPKIAKLAVVFISAIVHEWYLIIALGFFFPLLFFEFFLLGSFLGTMKWQKPVMNVFVWYSLALGMSSLITLYTAECYARVNVPTVDSTIMDVLIPRFLNYIE